MTFLTKLYGSCSIAFGVYGINRSLRADAEFTFTSTKLNNALLNGATYALPVFQLFPLCRLINRVEIQRRGWPKEMFCEQFREFSGYCFDTI